MPDCDIDLESMETGEGQPICPFNQQEELNHHLNSSRKAASTSPLPSMQDQHSRHLPGHPRILLSEKQELRKFLEKELYAADLERMAPWLWIMSTQDSTKISPLHRQEVEGRRIVITEEARLHLVWYYDRIFIKPLPEYLLLHNFWLEHFSAAEGEEQDRLQKAARGYLRTYLYLIVHQSDFRIAQELHLVPEQVTWRSFCDFTIGFKNICDRDVSGRYAYGEIRLTRLNFHAKFFLGRFHYHIIHAQYGAYFAQFYGPGLFTFGCFSVILSAMQNILSSGQLESQNHMTLQLRLCQGFSVWSIVLVLSLMAVLISLLAYKIIREWDFTLRRRYQYKKSLVRSSGRH